MSLTWLREIQRTENSAQRVGILSYDHIASAHVEHMSAAGMGMELTCTDCYEPHPLNGHCVCACVCVCVCVRGIG